MKVRMKVGAEGGKYRFENGREYTDADAPIEMLEAFVNNGFAVLIDGTKPAFRVPKKVKKIRYEHREMRADDDFQVSDGEEEI